MVGDNTIPRIKLSGKFLVGFDVAPRPQASGESKGEASIATVSKIGAVKLGAPKPGLRRPGR